MKLTKSDLTRLAKQPGRHRISDAPGLFLRVLDPDRVYWTYRYRFAGRENEPSLGPYPEIGLAEAIAKHTAMRASVLAGTDPLAGKRARRAAAVEAPPRPAPTFGEAADDFLDRKESKGLLGKNPKHRAQWRSTLDSLPASFRELRVNKIGSQHVFDALDPIWDKKPETASRLRARIAAVIDFARGPEDERRNPAAWSGWLKTQLGSAKKLGKIDRKTGERLERSHHAAMPYKDLPAFMKRLRDTPGVAAKALAFAILTAARSGEVLGALWDEIDLEHTATVTGADGKDCTVAIPLWTIPADRMKAGEVHRAPLCDAAIAILKEMREARVREHRFVFPGQRPRKPLSNMALEMTMRRLKAGAFTPHGMRSAFRDWVGDETHFQREIAEAALAHAVGDAAERAYRRGDALLKRLGLMKAWSQFVVPPPPSDNVIELRRAEA